MPNAEISAQTSARLQALAVPLVDTYDSVVSRLLDHWDVTEGSKPDSLSNAPQILKYIGEKSFDPALPPQLNFTTCSEIVIGNKKLGKGELYWNSLMNEMIRAVAAKGHDTKSIYSMLSVNAAFGKREDSGYKYLEDIDLSVQGQDSNAAYRQAYQLAVFNDIHFEVRFRWQDNPKAAFANAEALLKF